MEPFSAILAIAVPLVGLLVWWIRRKAETKASPEEHHRERWIKIDEDISKRNSVDATANASADLDEFERLQRAKGNHH